MYFTVMDGWMIQQKTFNINSAQALRDYVVWVNANMDRNVRISQDGFWRARSKGVINDGLATQWIDYIMNPSKYAGGGQKQRRTSGGGQTQGPILPNVPQKVNWLQIGGIAAVGETAIAALIAASGGRQPSTQPSTVV